MVPTTFREGILNPLLKKIGKKLTMPTNYRGITLISILGKLLELLLILRTNHKFKKAQSDLQRGFTDEVAPMFAALILIEIIAEAADNCEDITIIFLDAEKAFDTVWHDGLFRKLANIGIPADLWKIMRDWYTGFTCSVKWLGHLSKPYVVKQGVMQGGGNSPNCFKMDADGPIQEVVDRHLGAKIGITCCGAPMVADDLAVAAVTSTGDCQRIVGIAENHVRKDRRSFNGGKSIALHYSFEKKKKKKSNLPILLNNTPIPVHDQAVHLGILHSPNPDINTQRVNKHLEIATKTLYALFGAGLHGRNGINPTAMTKIWQSYILPRLLYGAEIWMLNKTQILRLETFQLKKLKQLQGLPPRTSSIAVRGLMGLLPIEAEIDRRALTLFRSAVSNPENIEYVYVNLQSKPQSQKAGSST
jgi:hypothetical protein